MNGKLRIWHIASIIAYFAVAFAILNSARPSHEWSIGQWLADACILVLLPPVLAGPIRAIVQFARRGELYAGEILWLWVGVVPIPVDRADRIIGWVCLSVVLATGVARFGVRPHGRPGAWAHHFGWGLFAFFFVWAVVSLTGPGSTTARH